MESAVPAVSVIVPVYNMERCLDRCVSSLVGQSLGEIEIHLVDDGSTDRSLSLCRQWAGRDARIRVHEQEHGGLSSARNRGLEHVRGDYVAFVDADDWTEPHMYEHMLGFTLASRCDLCLCDFAIVTRRGSFVVRLDMGQGVLADAAIRERLLYPMVGAGVYQRRYVYASVWRCLYRSALIRETGLRFVSEKEVLAEDLLFNADALAHSSSVGVLPSSCYTYGLSPGSLYRRFRPGLHEMNHNLMGMLEDLYRRHGLKHEASLAARRVVMAGAEVANEAKQDNKDPLAVRLQRIRRCYDDAKLRGSIHLTWAMDATLRNRMLMTCIRHRLVRSSYLMCTVRDRIVG